MMNLFLFQVMAHLLADYTLQSPKMAHKKNKKGFYSKTLKWHILIVFLTSAILGFDPKFLPFSASISLIHWLIDGFKPYLLKNKKTRKYAFFIDQALHLVVLMAIVLLFNSIFDWTPVFGWSFNSSILFFILAFLITTKPANIFIREIFNVYEIYFEGGEEDLPNAGRLIGIVERWLVLLFIFTGQVSAVGFLIGAKSILRFKDTNFLKTEYVLVGTLLSFGIAVALGLISQSQLFIL